MIRRFLLLSTQVFLSLAMTLTVLAQVNKEAKIPTKVVVTDNTQTAKKPLTNSDILNMTKGGFPESIIANSIQDNPNQFDLSVPCLFQLKDGGVSNTIIELMQTVSQSSSRPVTANPAPAPNSPSNTRVTVETYTSPYAVLLIDGNRRTEMKAGVVEGGKGNIIPFIGGKGKMVLKGQRAETRIFNGSPEFELSLYEASDPSKTFFLIKPSIKSESREIQVFKVNAVGKTSTGLKKGDLIPITIEEMKNSDPGSALGRLRRYRVRVQTPLDAGEYVFTNNGISFGSNFYDFAIDVSDENKSTISAPSPVESTKQGVASLPPSTPVKVAGQLSSGPSASSSPGSIDGQSVNASKRVDDPSTGVPEISIKGPIEKVRATLLQRYLKKNYNLFKDEQSQLVFTKEAGGVGGFVRGVLTGREGKNPVNVLTFVMSQNGKSTTVFVQQGIGHPDSNGLGTITNADSKDVRRELYKELVQVKALAEE